MLPNLISYCSSVSASPLKRAFLSVFARSHPGAVLSCKAFAEHRAQRARVKQSGATCLYCLQGACEKASQWPAALDLLAEMQQRPCNGDPAACSAWANRPKTLCTVPVSRQVYPNVIAFSSAISAYEKGGEWQRALQLFGTMATKKAGLCDMCGSTGQNGIADFHRLQGYPGCGELWLHD